VGIVGVVAADPDSALMAKESRVSAKVENRRNLRLAAA
jgi:hypothetical protein